MEERTHEEAFAPWQTEGLPPVPGPSNGANLVGGHCKVLSELGCQDACICFEGGRISGEGHETTGQSNHRPS